jgi:DNA-binding XRE family transcriptional regulator
MTTSTQETVGRPASPPSAEVIGSAPSNDELACHVNAFMEELKWFNSHRVRINLPMSQTKAAAALGVTREHLNRVLRGHRQSPPLLARFAAMQGEEDKRRPPPNDRGQAQTPDPEKGLKP